MRCPRVLGGLSVVALLAVTGPTHAQSEAPIPSFDAGRAYEHVRRLVAIGPRPAGSPAIARARQYMTDQLTDLGLPVDRHEFDADTPMGALPMVNLSVALPGVRAERLILAGHYDTKRFSRFPFVGANDGGSSAGFLIELARVLRNRRNPFTIEIVFFDGEEAVVQWDGDDHTYGSREYVARARREGTLDDMVAMVLVDMIGDRELHIRREEASTPWLTDAIWASARTLGHSSAFIDASMRVEDDHLHFLGAGIPAVDIIDLEYPAWHTQADTLVQIDAASLQIVGDVLLTALPIIEARLLEQTP